MQKDFDRWNRSKRTFTLPPTGRSIIREIWWCAVGVNVGNELDGTGKHHDRPVLIVRSFNAETFFGIAQRRVAADRKFARFSTFERDLPGIPTPRPLSAPKPIQSLRPILTDDALAWNAPSDMLLRLVGWVDTDAEEGHSDSSNRPASASTAATAAQPLASDAVMKKHKTR